MATFEWILLLKSSLLLHFYVCHTNAALPHFGATDVVGAAGSLDCSMRTLAFNFFPDLRDQHVYDALQLQHCGIPSPKSSKQNLNAEEKKPAEGRCENVVRVSPGEPVHLALARTRSYTFHKRTCARLELAPGIHFLNRTLVLDRRDNGLQIIGRGARDTWVSGGIRLAGSPSDPPPMRASNGLRLHRISVADGMDEVAGLFGICPHRRFQRARWPNGDTERDQWGYASPLSRKVSNPLKSVEEWVKHEPNGVPRFHYVDLRRENPTGFVKDDSTQEEYNLYTSGAGGVCDRMWDTTYSSSYWCGNASSGGWAEVDQKFAKSGTLGLPAAMRYATGSVAERAKSWKKLEEGPAVVHAWHSQSWFTNMFQVESHSIPDRTIRFGRGGSQGGRSWCQCDQCTYAAKAWCRSAEDAVDDRLISGNWYIENVREELDAPGEFYFDPTSRQVLLLLNASEADPSLVVPVLETLIRVEEGAENVRIEGIGFRDAKLTYLHKHGVPSGGDWSLYKGAAVMLGNVANVGVKACTFARLDGTALLVHDKARGVRIEESTFEWLGESAIALWGRTEEWDGRGGTQPRGTVIRKNVVREIGIYQKQSSAVFLAKACNTTIEQNLFYNMPRAAINLNDGFGGGNTIDKNLIFNTCRESGDHGAINSWDRQPFLYDASSGFSPKMTSISRNLIFANYGASQGVDNDDGSSFYNISSNVFYSADGFKMDYGGHDSVFVGNLVVTLPYDGANCFILGTFKAGHQHAFEKNKCVVIDCRGPCSEVIGFTASCDKPVAPLLARNEYYTKGCNATIKCGSKQLSLGAAQQSFPGLEVGSTKSCLPSNEQIMEWTRATLHGSSHSRVDVRTSFEVEV